VPNRAALAPPAATGAPPVRNGGHATVHAPEHALLVRLAALNRYSVRPAESTRIRPKRLFATWTVAVWVGVVVVFDGAGGGDAVAAPPPPQAATARALSGITTALARKVAGLLRVMSLLRLGEIDGRTDQR